MCGLLGLFRCCVKRQDRYQPSGLVEYSHVSYSQPSSNIAKPSFHTTDITQETKDGLAHSTKATSKSGEPGDHHKTNESQQTKMVTTRSQAANDSRAVQELSLSQVIVSHDVKPIRPKLEEPKIAPYPTSLPKDEKPVPFLSKATGTPLAPPKPSQPYVFIAGGGSVQFPNTTPAPAPASAYISAPPVAQISNASSSRAPHPNPPSYGNQSLPAPTNLQPFVPAPPLPNPSTVPRTQIRFPIITGQCKCGSANTIRHVGYKPDSINVGRPYRSCEQCGNFNGFADERGLTPGFMCDCETPAMLRLVAKNRLDHLRRREAFYSCQFKTCGAWANHEDVWGGPTLFTEAEVERMVRAGEI